MASIQYFKHFKQRSRYVGGKYNLCIYLKLIFDLCFIVESYYKDHANFLHRRKEQPVIWGKRSLGSVEGGIAFRKAVEGAVESVDSRTSLI